MQRPQYRQGSAIDGVSSLRVHVHDLRNLFAVVASAKYLLERPLAEQKHRTVLEALGKVAAEGMVLTNGLLCDGHACQPEVADAPEALRKLEPMLVALAGAERQIRLEIDETPARVGVAQASSGPTQL